MITYFKNQRDLAETLNKYIDDYWAMKISEKDLIDYLKQVYKNNKDKIIKGNQITSVVKQRLGKKRLELIIKIMEIGEENNK
ncbi:TIGR04540 family protein [Clostridiaceae bacterium HSG29]|nr:TIGR04540 family protein [Clostridiaceae bacterium HSG29]